MSRQDLQRQQEYYNYVDNQQANAVDLSTDSNQIQILAQNIFSKKPLDTRYDTLGLTSDGTMEIADVFCMLLELVLYGLDILSNKKSDIFMLKESTDDIIYLIKNYLRPLGFTMHVEEILIDIENINLFRDASDYYCEINKRPPPFLCFPGWYILDYRFILNKKFTYDTNTKLDTFSAKFLNKEKRLFKVHFDKHSGS